MAEKKADSGQLPVVSDEARAADEMTPEALLRLAAEKLEAKRGNRAKTYARVAEQARALAERIERL